MLKHLKFLCATAVTLALTSPSLAKDAVDAETVVATVNGTPVTVGQMIMVRSALPQQYLTMPDDVLFTAILDQIIQQNVLAQAHEGDDPKRLEIALQSERRLILADSVVEKFLSNMPTDAEVQAAYDAKYSGFEGPTEYNAAHILVASEEEAVNLRQKIVDGADFADMAKEHSTGPSGPSGGALGWFGAGMMVPEFETAVFEMEVGGVSEPVQTQFGWHLIKLNETRKQEVPMIDDIRGELIGEIQGAKLDAFIDSLTAKSEIDRTSAEGIDPAVIKDATLLDD
ncbi:peptidylprolyl isomerase [Shimia sp. SDUM112013]|uniref:peptidylprolyl isomerase n=1 Tax=Shimia sp. SDUM112013 TaxID=3136160 RepID=UPI0032EBC73F